ncbi:MAG: hypothetical protein AAB371_01410 [Patescibacteria group bacterium]
MKNYSISKLHWTNHSKAKMSFYGLSESRVKRVLRTPKRVEEGVAENTIALMQPPSIKKRDGKEMWTQEIWVMIQKRGEKLRIISAWRYPGKSSEKNPIPKEIIDDLKSEGII